jgi:Ser/Thr protein kinase RdoA (MazF antagonist)
MESAAVRERGELSKFQRLAEAALQQYGLSPRASATLLNQSENVTYRIDDPATGLRSVLRIHRVGYHSRDAIASELAWMEALRREGVVPTAEAIPARDGSIIQVLESPDLPEARHAVMFTFLTGSEPPEESLAEPFERLGEVTAHMHVHAKSWARSPEFVRHVWDLETMFGPEPTWGRWQEGIGVDGDALRLLGRLCEALHRRIDEYGKGPERFGLVHADLRLANLLVDGPVTRVIDFDDCGFSWYIYDLAAALSFIEHRHDVPQLITAWLKGYRRTAPLAAVDEDEIWTFILLRRLLLVAWVGSHAETETAQSQGAAFTIGTCRLAREYLARFG